VEGLLLERSSRGWGDIYVSAPTLDSAPPHNIHLSGTERQLKILLDVLLNPEDFEDDAATVGLLLELLLRPVMVVSKSCSMGGMSDLKTLEFL
jgi:hypothetical protein